MAGGFIKGVLWGGVVSLGVAGAASVLSDRTNGALPVVVASETAPDAVPETVPETVPEPSLETALETVPETVLEIVPETVLETVPDAVTQAAPEPSLEKTPAEVEVAVAPDVQAVPVVSSETIAPTPPTIEDASAADEVTQSAETGQTNTSKPDKPGEEVGEADVSADKDPAPVPQVGSGASGLENPSVRANQGRVDVQTDAQVRPDRKSYALEPPQDEAPLSVATEPATPPPPKPVGAQAAVSPTPDTEAAPSPEPVKPAQNEVASVTPEPSVEPAPETQSAATVPAEGTAGQANSEQVATLAPKIATNRLPTVQTTPSAPDSEEPEQVGTIVFDSELEPIRRFAVPFENRNVCIACWLDL